MSLAPWNKTAVREWISYDLADVNTHPRPNQRVIALDTNGSMAICWHDAITYDFLVVLDGVCEDEMKMSVYGFFIGLIDEFAKQDKHLLSLKNRLENSLKDFEADEGFTFQNDELSLAIERFIDLPSTNNKMDAVYFDDVIAWMEIPPISEDCFDAYGTQDYCAEVHMKTYDVMTAIEPYIREAISKVVKNNAP